MCLTLTAHWQNGGQSSRDSSSNTLQHYPIKTDHRARVGFRGRDIKKFEPPLGPPITVRTGLPFHWCRTVTAFGAPMIIYAGHLKAPINNHYHYKPRPAALNLTRLAFFSYHSRSKKLSRIIGSVGDGKGPKHGECTYLI